MPVARESYPRATKDFRSDEFLLVGGLGGGLIHEEEQVHDDVTRAGETARRGRRPYRSNRLESHAMKPFLLLAALVLVAGCDTHDAEQSSTAGRGVTVERLFVHEGVAVYRFSDAGKYHYFAVPRTGPAEVVSAWEQCIHTNKTTTCWEERDEMPTVARR